LKYIRYKLKKRGKERGRKEKKRKGEKKEERFPVTKKVVSCASKKRKAVADSAVEIEENTNVVDIEGGDVNNANTNVEAADVDDTVVNEDNNGNDNQVLLTERLTVHNVVIDRTLEEGVPQRMLESEVYQY